MKVLHVCPYMHPAAGGPPVVVTRYCELSPRYGWDARVITTSLFCEDDGSALRRALSERIEIELLPVNRPRLLGLASGGEKAIESGVRSANIVHVHTLWHPFGTMVRQACARFDRPYIMMPHGMLDPISLNMKRWRKLVVLNLVEKANLQAAQRIVYTSPEEQRLAERHLNCLPAGIVSPLGADDPPSAPKDDLQSDFLARFPEAAGRRCILFLGRLHPKKGLDRILRVLPTLIERCPRILLIVTGNGDQGYVKSIHRQVEARDLNQSVLFTGLLQGELKWSAFAMAEVFLLPSRQENFAISVAEAMRMAVPVVITDRVNSWPYVEEAKAGVVLKWDNIDGPLLEIVTHLLEDTAAAREMGRNGRSYATSNLNWQNATQRIIACYEAVMRTTS